MNSYTIGDKVRITGTFTTSAGAAIDPTAVVVVVKYPRYGFDKTTTTYTYAGGGLTRSGTGIYYVDVTVTTEGIWDYRIYGTGTVTSAEEGAFNVPDSQFF